MIDRTRSRLSKVLQAQPRWRLWSEWWVITPDPCEWWEQWECSGSIRTEVLQWFW